MSNKQKSIYIFKTSPTSLLQVEAYLKNRQWQIGSGTDLREALGYILRHRPNFVLIPSNHPSKKVRALPKLLIQNLPVTIIAYSESMDASSMTALREIAQSYTLFPPISGPAVERMILRIERDFETLTRKKSALNQNEQAKAAIDRLLNAREDEVSGIAYMPQLTGEPESPSHTLHKGSFPNLKGAEWREEQTHPFHPNNPVSELENSQSSKVVPILPKTNKFLLINGLEVTDESRENIVVRGTMHALEFTANEKDEFTSVPIQPVGQTSQVGCILIDTPRFSGYHLTSTGKGDGIENDFMLTIKKKLYTFLKDHGEHPQDEEPMQLKIRTVNFQDWALKHADFICKTQHESSDLVVAFFSQSNLRPKIEPSAIENMYKIAIEELKADTIMEFDLYIHLHENNKYFLYTAQGKVFPLLQKNRLQSLGVTHMFFRKTAITDVQKYKAQNQINDSIDLYQQSQGAP
jgi:hypothetical protein